MYDTELMKEKDYETNGRIEEKEKRMNEEPVYDFPLHPLVRFFCKFPSSYPESKKFGLQFTCLRQEDNKKKIVIKKDDEFGDMERHTIEDEFQLLPYSVEKVELVGKNGNRSVRDVITVVLSPEEFLQLLSNITKDVEIIADVSRQIEEALKMRQLKKELISNIEKKYINEIKGNVNNTEFEKHKVNKEELLDDSNNFIK